MTRNELNQQDFERRYALEYDSVGEVQLGIAIVERNDYYGIINSSGQLIVPLIYTYISDFRNHLAAAYIGEKGCFIDNNGNQVTPMIYDDISLSMQGDLFAPKFSCGLVLVRVEGKYGFVNKAGEQVIESVYDSAQDFSTKGLSIVKRDNKWGIINSKGEIVIEIKYDKIFEINKKGYISVEINGVFEVIDFSGKILSNKELEDFSKKKLR